MSVTVAALHRFPVKGLSPERLPALHLEQDAYVPGDRLFAIENGPSGYDEAAPRHLPKVAFLMLMRNARLARLQTRFDAARQHLSIAQDGTPVCEADLASQAGRAEVEQALARFCQDELRGPLRLRAAAPGFRFTDSKKGFVSLINLASVRAIADAIGRPVDPLRFRANIAIDGAAAWWEKGLVGRRIRVGGTTLEVLSETERCAATAVDPSTGARDLAVVDLLVRHFGHNACGVYARVAASGGIRDGDEVATAD